MWSTSTGLDSDIDIIATDWSEAQFKLQVIKLRSSGMTIGNIAIKLSVSITEVCEVIYEQNHTS